MVYRNRQIAGKGLIEANNFDQAVLVAKKWCDDNFQSYVSVKRYVLAGPEILG